MSLLEWEARVNSIQAKNSPIILDYGRTLCMGKLDMEKARLGRSGQSPHQGQTSTSYLPS